MKLPGQPGLLWVGGWMCWPACFTREVSSVSTRPFQALHSVAATRAFRLLSSWHLTLPLVVNPRLGGHRAALGARVGWERGCWLRPHAAKPQGMGGQDEWGEDS